jgi:hypothetical protein
MKNAAEIAKELLDECRNPLHTKSIFAVHPDYTEKVFQAALELAFAAGAKGGVCEPEAFRKAANGRAQELQRREDN